LQAASQISGMTPAALDILQIYIKMAGKKWRLLDCIRTDMKWIILM
jgi:hypothetical protein